VSDQPLAGVSVLIADDSDINRVLLTKILERAGARVFGVANGRKAVELVRARGDELDVVLMDLQMPELDGEQATRTIRGELGRKRLPIIALSAGVLASDRAQAFAAEMDDFVQKPFERRELLERVATHAARFRTRIPSAAPAAEPVPDDWPEIDGIDGADARARLGGDRELFSSLLERLARELDDFCADVRANAGVGEPARWAARLHKLRGMAGNLGARRFAQAAAELEKRARADDTALGPALTLLCVDATELSRAVRGAPAAAPAAAGRKPEPPTAVEWDRFLAALTEQDLDALESFPRFSAWLCARIGTGRHDELRAALDALDFARARDIARGA
jgi:CheY-like chemotaxis protein/HPt (histidine-containing phosphotransfer) domain-containing protein